MFFFVFLYFTVFSSPSLKEDLPFDASPLPKHREQIQKNKPNAERK